jgi:hypothetical protein
MTKWEELSRRHLLLGMAGGIVCLGARPVLAEEVTYSLISFPPVGKYQYRILRDDEEIGHHDVEFRRESDRLTVLTEMEAVVTMADIPVFRFEHAAEEHWTDSQLVSLSSRTNDDGTDREVELKVDGDRMRVVYNGKEKDYDGPMIPASLWHPATVKQSVLFDPVRGRPRQVTVAARGPETVKAGREDVATNRFSITGELKREVWYSLDEKIVQVTFPAKDGSLITILRRA